MGFLVPVFAAFAALAAIPLLIHLFGRPRATRRRFAAIGFLLKSEKKTAPQRRLREILLLAARALAIAAVPLILAKPYFETASGLPTGMGASEGAVIVLDDSRSMELVHDGRTRFAAAQAEAQRLVDGMGRDSEAAVLLTSQGTPAPVAELIADRARLKRAVAAARPTRRPGDTTAALRRAAAILAASPRAVRRVYLVSDLAAHGFSADAPWGANGPSLVPIDVGGDDAGARANHAVVDLRVVPAPQLGPRGIEVQATIANDSEQPLKDETVTLRVDGKAVAKGGVDAGAGERVVKRFFHVLDADTPAAPSPPSSTSIEGGAAHATPSSGGGDPDGAEGDARREATSGVHELAVELPADDFPDDDRRYARIEARRDVRVLLVDGDPRTVRREDELFYLETALHPGDGGESRLAVHVTTLDDLVRRRLDDEDVIFLANAKAPDAERAALLGAFVARGGGLFVSAGDNVDPDAWNVAMGDLLPQPLATVRTVGATLQARDDGEARVGGDGERIARFDRRHPVLAPFEGAAAATTTPKPDGAPGTAAAAQVGDQGSAEALREARVSRYVLLRPTPGDSGGDADRRVLLRLDSGAPLLVEGKKGAGRVMLLTTTIDRDWSDLAIQPAFLPLVQQATRYLARAPLADAEPPSLIGQPHEIPLGDGDERVEVTLPSGSARWFGEDRVAGRKTLHFTETDEPGLYKVAIARHAGGVEPRAGAAFVVNVDRVESALAKVSPERLAALSHPTAGKDGAAAAPRHRVQLWHALGGLLLALLLVEGALGAFRW